MRLPRHRVAAATDEEVQIRAGIRLKDMVEVKPLVASGHGGRHRFPMGPPPSDLLVGYIQMQASLLHVQFYAVALADLCERTTDRRLRRHMQYHRPIRRTAHARIRDPDHVRDAALQQFWGKSHV